MSHSNLFPADVPVVGGCLGGKLDFDNSIQSIWCAATHLHTSVSQHVVKVSMMWIQSEQAANPQGL